MSMPLSISDINLPGYSSLASTVSTINANITSLLNSRGIDENLIAVANGNITTL